MLWKTTRRIFKRKIAKRWLGLGGDGSHLAKLQGYIMWTLPPKLPGNSAVVIKLQKRGEKRQHDGIQNNALKAHREIKTFFVRLLCGASGVHVEKGPDIAKRRVKLWPQETQELKQTIFWLKNMAVQFRVLQAWVPCNVLFLTGHQLTLRYEELRLRQLSSYKNDTFESLPMQINISNTYRFVVIISPALQQAEKENTRKWQNIS